MCSSVDSGSDPDRSFPALVRTGEGVEGRFGMN